MTDKEGPLPAQRVYRSEPDIIDIQLADAQTELAKQARIANLLQLAQITVPFGNTDSGKLQMEDNAKVWLIAQAAELLGLPAEPPDPITITKAYKEATQK